jgi:predicted enzyme related to lactoylglutathione lyase
VLTRDDYPTGVPCWIDLPTPDPEAAAGFYGRLLGWELEDAAPAGAGPYLIARLGGATVAAIGAPAAYDPQVPAWTTYVCVDEADAAAARVHDAGGKVVAGPEEVGEAGRLVACADPEGAAFRLWQPRARRGAELVNAPGTWNWSDLTAADLDGAAAFYGSVFGWAAQESGYGDALLWRRPGYGDFLAERDPSLRERHGAAGVPDGFSDAIGWLAPRTGDSSRWDVTFSVADADAVARDAAAAAGGEVLTPPHDVGGVARMTVLADPQGARFTASQFLGVG